jgi:hypothetical protein
MAGKLKPLNVKRETKPGKYADGDGLYLIVAGATSKNWSYRYWKDSKERWHGLGSYKDVSLSDARLARDAARLRVKGDRSMPGVDIVQEKREVREEQKAVEAKTVLPSFEECAFRPVIAAARDKPHMTAVAFDNACDRHQILSREAIPGRPEPWRLMWGYRTQTVAWPIDRLPRRFMRAWRRWRAFPTNWPQITRRDRDTCSNRVRLARSDQTFGGSIGAGDALQEQACHAQQLADDEVGDSDFPRWNYHPSRRSCLGNSYPIVGAAIYFRYCDTPSSLSLSCSSSNRAERQRRACHRPRG